MSGAPSVEVLSHYRASSPQQLRFPWRRPPGLGLWLVRAGQLRVETAEERGRVAPGDILCTVPTRPFVQSSSAATQHDGLTMRVQLGQGLDPWVLWQPPLVIRGDAVLAQRLGAVVVSLEAERDGAAGLRLHAALLELVAAVLELSALRQAPPGQADDLERLLPVLDVLARHRGPLPDRKELARLVGLGPSGFYRLFRRVLGCSPQQWYERRRIEEAERLLHRTNLSLAAIAERLGYADAFHLSRRFKAMVGHSPRGA
ncbi:MAG: AraC family transcriptional regulator [Planctomycetota bacterium]|jgi:AraC-like DNA-binding protein|nr:AraC family transcriptional regulator [Planctomycetota bacterium]